MKYLLRFLLLAFFILLGYGYLLKNSGDEMGDKWIGVSILLLALVIMPLFIFHRYKNKNFSDYMYKTDKREEEKSENQ